MTLIEQVREATKQMHEELDKVTINYLINTVIIKIRIINLFISACTSLAEKFALHLLQTAVAG